MNESYERSYYEIALTNSQVLSALAVMLLCLLGSFVAGMWVAREAQSPPAASAGVAASEPEAETKPAESGEFQFFRRQGAGEQADNSSSGQQSNVAEQRAPRTVAPVEVAPARTAEPAAQRPAPQRQPPQQQARRQEPRSAPSTVPAPAPARDAGAAVASGQADQELVIQVLSSSDQAQAGKVADQLKGSGFRAFLSSAEVEGRTMYRVRVGPYFDQGQAAAAADKIKRQFRLNTWITSQN